MHACKYSVLYDYCIKISLYTVDAWKNSGYGQKYSVGQVGGLSKLSIKDLKQILIKILFIFCNQSTYVQEEI